MNVICAEPMGICHGVRDALAATEHIERPQTVTILGQLVHNEIVQSRLRTRGFHVMAQRDRRRLPSTPNVLITAHGISGRRRQKLLSAGKRLIDTTCLLVRRVQRMAKALQSDGYYVLVIGRPGHAEVLGIVEDLSDYEVVADVADVHTYPHDRLGIVCQTTTPPRVAEEIHLAIGLRNLRAEVRFENTVCRATSDRQAAVERLLPKVEAMVVVGGRDSNNTRELVAACRQQSVPTLHVQAAADLHGDWFHGLGTVGLTAGTSTIEATIEEVYDSLCQQSPCLSHERT